MPNSHCRDSNVPVTSWSNITVDLEEMWCDNVYKICMVHDRFHCWTLKHMAMYLQILYGTDSLD